MHYVKDLSIFIAYCMRQESANERNRNTMKDFILLNPSAKRVKNYILPGYMIYDSTILLVKISITKIPLVNTVNPNVPLLTL